MGIDDVGADSTEDAATAHRIRPPAPLGPHARLQGTDGAALSNVFPAELACTVL